MTEPDPELLALIDDPDTPNEIIADWLEEHAGMKMHSVYVVMGQTGEYSDQSSWHVAAFARKELADALCERLTRWCEDNGASARRGGYTDYPEDGSEPPRPEEDPKFEHCYTGTAYTVVDVPLRG